jgi:hypothetical protein
VADQRTRAADSAQISQRRAAGMRCAAGQLAERRADCAADSAHIWSTWSASMVDLSARTRSVRRASRSQISQRSRKDRPHHGVDIVRIELWPPPAVPSGIAVRLGAPRASVRWWRRQAGSIAWRPRAWPGLVVGRFTQAEPCRAGGYLVRLWGGTAGVLRRQSGRTTLRPRSVSLFQESPGCPPGSGRPVAGPPGSSSAPGSTPNSSGDPPCHCPGPHGTVRRGSEVGELRERAGCKRHAWPVPPPASRWLPARASLGTP